MDPYDFGEGISQSTTLMETTQVNINDTTPVSALSISEKRKFITEIIISEIKKKQLIETVLTHKGQVLQVMKEQLLYVRS